MFPVKFMKDNIWFAVEVNIRIFTLISSKKVKNAFNIDSNFTILKYNIEIN